MNHIHRLQQDLHAAHSELAATHDALASFRAHLLGPKFQGTDPDGSRRDWIAVSDVFAWLRAIETAHESVDA